MSERLKVGDVALYGGRICVVSMIEDMGIFFGRLVLGRDIAGQVVHGNEIDFERLAATRAPRTGGDDGGE